MSKPVYTVVMDIKGTASVVKRVMLKQKSKGTSLMKATKIAEEINNA